jgi:hypothetical protein
MKYVKWRDTKNSNLKVTQSLSPHLEDLEVFMLCFGVSLTF